MLTGKIINNEPKFDPVTIQITIDNQDDLDKFASLVNHAWVTDVFKNIHCLNDILKGVGGDNTCFLDRYSESFKKRCK